MKCSIHRIAVLAVVWLGACAAGSAQEPDSGGAAQSPADRAFVEKVAPLLRARCLECHDSASREGGLDLSRKETAFAGGDSGAAIVAGKAKESLLYQQVEADDMPQDRPPLSAADKRLLQQWLNDGAAWPLESLAPAPPADGANWLQRLTVREYIESVRVAVGVDIAEEARRLLPPDLRADGFSNTAYNLNVDLQHVESYANLAALIVDRLNVPAFASRFAKGESFEEAHLRKLIAAMGKWIVRGPLSDDEIEAYLQIAKAVKSEQGDYREAVAFMVEAMLQSPRFLYRIESQRGDGAVRPVNSYEMASRLSYILWGAPPDELLFEAAEQNKLESVEQLRAQVERMLRDPRAIDRSCQFIAQWLDLDRLDNLRPNPEHFPQWNQHLARDMREETLAFFRDVAWEQQRPLAELLNAQITHVTPRLAAHYALPHVDGLSDGLVNSRYEGLEALYLFNEGTGSTVRDHSGRGSPLDLHIDRESAVEWSNQGLTLRSKAVIVQQDPSPVLAETLERTKAFTLEAWVASSDPKQSGPARIVSLSSGVSNRNFTLGQDSDRYDVRFRTSKTDNNGMPSLASRGGAVKKELTHVVYTREAGGEAKLYVNGAEQAARNVAGNLDNWDTSYRLVIGNETSGDRPWLGTYRYVALYSRSLAKAEVRDRFNAGPWQPIAKPVRYDLSTIPHRGGLLTQGSVLTIGGDHSSMVTRGLFVLHDLLHGKVSDPPPCVDTTPIPTKPGLTQRSIAEARIANRACGGCHERFEPLAFGLERFDALGAYHETDRHGNKLRDDGVILFPGTKEPVGYDSSAELMKLLAGSEQVSAGITRKVTQFALGRPLVDSDSEHLQQIHACAQREGGTYASLITAIVTSDLVRMTRTEPLPSGELNR